MTHCSIGGRLHCRLFFIALLALLAACGGGGPGGEPAPNWPAGGSDGTTGLVPAAQAPGEVLSADSATYRPLRAGTRWQYMQTVGPQQPPLVPTVAMRAGTAERFIETRTDIDLTVELWRTSAGDTFTSVDLPLAQGRSLRLSGPELTRELRAGQQIKSIDSRRADIGFDIDGDGRTDGADLAYWRVVVGFEEIELPASPKPVRTLRLDERVVVRTLSSRGGVISSSTLYGSSWYRAGIGVVRTVVWSDASATTATSDEQLLGYDGIERGFGFTTVPRAAGSGGQAVPFGSGYLSLSPDSGSLTVANARGERLGESRARRAGEPNWRRQLLPTALGMRMAAVYNRSDGSPTQFELDAIDANGQLLPGPLAVHPLRPFLQLSSGDSISAEIASHPLSEVVWLAYRETDIVPQPDASLIAELKLVIHRFDANGVALGPPLRLPANELASSHGFQVLALADRAFILAPESPGNGGHRLLELANDGSVLLDRRYALAAGATLSTTFARLLVDGASRWLIWNGPGEAGTAPTRPYAMRLAADGAPLDVPSSLEGALASALPWPAELQTRSWPDRVLPAPAPLWVLPANRVLPGGVPVPGIAIFDAGSGDPRQQPAPRWAAVPGTLVPWVTLADRTLFDDGYGGIFGSQETTVRWHD